MKKATALSRAMFLMLAIAFTSCDSEPVDTELLNTPDNENNPGQVDGGSDTSGSYWPMAINNEWIFNDGDGVNTNMKIIGTETINNKLYYKYENFLSNSVQGNIAGEGTVHTRLENHQYFVRAGVSVTGQPGLPTITVSPIEYSILKDNVPVGESWTQNIVQTTTFDIPDMPVIENNLTVTCTIAAKYDTVELDGVTYTDVIKVSVSHVMDGLEEAEGFYWFAKNKGMVKAELSAPGSGGTVNYILESLTIN